MFHRKRAKTLAPVWQKELRAAPGKRKLSFLYLANDVLQNSRKKGSEWIEALWPKMEWAVKHTLRATSDEKTAKSCAKLVKVWLDRRIFGSRSLEGWLDARAETTPPTPPPAAAAADGGGGGRARAPVARRKEERLTEIPAALTGKNAALAKALEAAEKAIAALAAADATCAADLRDEVLADGFAEAAADPEDAKRALKPPSPRSRRAARPWRRARGSARRPRASRARCARCTRRPPRARARRSTRAPASPSGWRRSA